MGIRRIWETDSDLIKNLLRIRSSLGGVKLTAEEFSLLEERIDLGLKNLNSVFWADTNPDGSLRCLLVQVIDPRWPDTWNASLLCTDGSSSIWDYRVNGLDELWRVAFTWGRAKGRRKVVWSLPLSWARTRRRTENRTVEWLKYDVQDLEVIPAGEVPTDPFKLWIFGGQPKPYPVQLRQAVPKQSLSPEDLKSLQASNDRGT